MNATSNRSSVESLMAETPNKYNKKNKRKMTTTQVAKNKDDEFLDKIVKPVNAKTKKELMKGSGAEETGPDSYRDNKRHTDVESQITIDSRKHIGR